MNKIESKESLQAQTNQATLCFLIDGDRVLLGKKKRRFAEGKWNGYGGKRNEDETILQTAIREFQEEAGITPKSLVQVATLDCYHPDWNQQVVVYTVSEWEGTPEETEEMIPQWFPKEELPLSEMWPDEAIWLPLVLEGKKLRATFQFNKEGELLKQEITAVKNFG